MRSFALTMLTMLGAGALLGPACAPLGKPEPVTSRAIGTVVVSTDVDAFWAAYDSIRTTTDSLAQLRILRAHYLDRGTRGLAAFRAAREYTAEDWVGAIRQYPRFWASIRPRTVEIGRAIADSLAAPLSRLRTLYPPLRPATVYVTIGALGSGGTTLDSLVLIGAELAAGGPETDIEEFTGGTRAFLARYFASRPRTTLVLLTMHEVVHTQQRGIGRTVLARALREGGADFVTERVMGMRPPLRYMTAGPARESSLREQFRVQMYSGMIYNWFYNQTSADTAHVPDLGYYMGYAITRAYYERAPDKAAALRDIIELPYDDDAAVEAFLVRSGYYSERVDRAALMAAYEALRPTVVRVVPLGSSSPATAVVDTGVTELRIEFSAPMNPRFTGVGLGAGGRAELPITGRMGFTPDGRAYTFRVSLAPGRRYSFVLEGSETGGFRGADGFPLRPDTVTFTTRARAPAAP